MGQHHEYRFGDFVVDREAWQLRRSGQVVHLEPAVLNLLVYLIEHRDRLVPKQELMDTVWGDTVVSEAALSKAVARLRKALGDDAAHPKFVETAYALGYRFIADVHESTTPEDDVQLPEKRRRGVWSILAAAVLAVVVIAFVTDPADWFRQSPDADGPTEIRSLAVLPLANLSGEPDSGYLVNGLQDVLITDLSRIGGLKVISRQSTLRYRNSDQSAPEIARELGVDALVEGGVMWRGDRVKVTAQLIHGGTDQHLWAQSYDRGAQDMLTLIGEIARAISHEIDLVLSPQQEEQLSNVGPVDPRATDFYLRAVDSMNRFTGEELLEALRSLEQAVAIEPGFARAWGGMAGAHLLIAYYGGGPPRQHVMQARAAALNALELDPQDIAGHAALAWVRLFTWDWPGAGQAFEQALRLNPNNTTTLHGYADYLTLTGRAEEGLVQVRRAASIDPHSPISNLPVPFHLYLMRRYDEALAEVGKLLEQNADYPVHWLLMMIYWEQGRLEDALEAYRRQLTVQGGTGLLAALDRGHADSGPAGAMRAVAVQMALDSEERYVDPFTIASRFAMAGDPDRAFEWLEKALERGSLELIYLGVRPDFDALRADERFADLLRRLALPERQAVD